MIRRTSAGRNSPHELSQSAVCRATTALLRALALALTVATMSGAAHAQAVPGTLIQGDNDALDVWLPEKQRPDGEYTNGLRVSISRAAAPIWGRFVPSAAPCTARETSSQRCLTTEFAIAQQMYTPEPLSHRLHVTEARNGPSRPWFDLPNTRDSIVSAPIPGDRPFAGWLHGDVTANIISERRLTSFGLVAGFTGRASGAEAVQKGFHHLIGQIDPPGWSEQLGFRPALDVSYTDHLRAVLARAGDRDFVDILPSWSAQAGNARTSAFGEIVARAGYHLAHPWSPAARARAGVRDFGIWLYGGMRETLVAYDQTLDRGYVKNDTTYSVSRLPWVYSYDFGIAVRRHSLTITFGGTHTGKEYRTEEVPNHSFGTLAVTVDR